MNKLKTTGIVGGIAFRVKMTEDNHEFLKKGDIVYLEPIELSVNGDIIQALYRSEMKGCPGAATWPKFKTV